MPIKVAQIATNTAQVTFPVAGETCTVVYYPAQVTEQMFATMQQLSTSADGNAVVDSLAALNDILARLIKSWDVLEDDGSMYPIVPDRLAALPMMFRVQVLSEIIGNIRPEQLATQG